MEEITAQINKVSSKIDAAEVLRKKRFETWTEEEKQVFGNKDQLRDEEKQPGEEEKHTREEEKQRRKKEEQLRDKEQELLRQQTILLQKDNPAPKGISKLISHCDDVGYP